MSREAVRKKEMWRNAVLFSVWAFCLCQPGHAQTQPVIAGAPDVLVLVYQRPGLGDQVDVTYAQTIPRDQVMQDMSALTKETGWTLGPNAIKDAAAPVSSKFGPMTSVIFTAPNVIQNETHTLPVETFARAFRGYKRLNLVFIVSSGFTFQGPRQYADNHLEFTLDQHGAAYTYQVAILNPNFDGLNVGPQSKATQSGGRHAAPVLIFVSILGVSVLAGLIVFVLAKRLTSQTSNPVETKDDSEEPLETVTRR